MALQVVHDRREVSLGSGSGLCERRAGRSPIGGIGRAVRGGCGSSPPNALGTRTTRRGSSTAAPGGSALAPPDRVGSAPRSLLISQTDVCTRRSEAFIPISACCVDGRGPGRDMDSLCGITVSVGSCHLTAVTSQNHPRRMGLSKGQRRSADRFLACWEPMDVNDGRNGVPNTN